MAAIQVSENWDDEFDFEDSRQSPKKVVQRHRAESWDEDDDESAEFGLFAEEDRTVTAKSRRRLTTPLPPPTRSPTSSVFSVPTTIHTYSSTTHLLPVSTFARISPSPPIHKERQRRRLRKKSRPKPHGVFELIEIPSTQERPSFSDVDEPPPLLPPIELQPHLPPPPTAAPPIELQPPSPPSTMATPKTHMQTRSRAYTTNEFIEGPELDNVLPSATTSSKVFLTPTSSLGSSMDRGSATLPSLSPGKLSPGKSPQSQQSVSLGRSTVAVSGDEGGSLLAGASANGGSPRRNSLGDLKIPARISQAQVGLRRDLGMVKEFASNVEQLKELQNTYNTLVGKVQTLLDTHRRVQSQPIEPSLPLDAAIPKPTSPNFFTRLKPRPKTRARSNTTPTPGSITPTPETVNVDNPAYKSLVEAFWTIHSKYRIAWERAELLIELGSGGDGGGVMSAPASAATTSVSAPVIQQESVGMAGLKGRERAITLVGDGFKRSMTPPLHNEAQTQVQSPLTGSTSMPIGTQSASSSSGGPALASPSSMSWRPSTGRHDLSQRQLVLLREMLHNNNDNNSTTLVGDERRLRPPIPVMEDDPELSGSALSPSRFQYLNRDWRWGDAMNSTITLSEEREEGGRMKMEKRRSGWMGMSGIWDMLRAVKKSHGDDEVQDGQQQQHHHHHRHGRLSVDVPGPMMHSTTSLSTESSMGRRSVDQAQQQQQQNRLPTPRTPSQIRRRSRANTGPELIKSNKAPSPTPYNNPSTPKPSNRRPSLASIFRIGSGHHARTRSVISSSGGVSVGEPRVSFSASGVSERDLSGAWCDSAASDTSRGEDSNSMGEEDWNRMDSASDLKAAGAAEGLGMVNGVYDVSATVRGHSGLKNKTTTGGVSPYLQLQHSSTVPVPSRHSDFKEKPQPTNVANLEPASIRISSSKSAPTMTSGQAKVLQVATVDFSAGGSTPRPPSRPSSSRSTTFPNTLSVHSTPPHLVAPTGIKSELPDPKFKAMILTLENVKPLLENAKEVQVMLDECVAEIRALVEGGCGV